MMRKLVLFLFMMVVCASFSAMYAQTQTTKLFLDMSTALSGGGRWDDGGAVINAWRWGGSEADSWTAAFVPTGVDHVYMVDIPAGTTNVILMRRNPGDLDLNSWDKRWDRMGIEGPGIVLNGNNCVIITGWNSNSGSNAVDLKQYTALLALPSLINWGVSVSLSATSSTSGVSTPPYTYTYEVKGPGDSDFQTVTSLPYWPAAPGTYTFRANLSSSTGTIFATSSEVVVTVQTPTISLNPLTSPINLGSSVSLSATPTNIENPVVAYEVKGPADSDFQTVTSPYWPTAFGIYTFRAKVSSSSNNNSLSGIFFYSEVVNVTVSTVTLTLDLEEGPYYVEDVITLGHTSINLDENVDYRYYVKKCNDREDEDCAYSDEPISNEYTPEEPGYYCFIVKAFLNTESDVLLATSDEVCVPVVIKPTVTLANNLPITRPAGTFINEDDLGTESTGVDNPCYTYWIKEEEEADSEYLDITSSFPFTRTEGSYIIKVGVTEGCDSSDYLAYDTESLTFGPNTGVAKTTTSGYTVTSGSGVIQAQVEGTAVIELYTVSGVLLKKTAAVGSFEQTGLAPGLYIVKINGEANKVAVK
ncbi:MAG: T9SS type A sorting domain-containing protein [Candidatus Azobacteroides sp.]|nr:T9SS type A sorting domain-containing protein [Candidatus Azobacteroides sp.]